MVDRRRFTAVLELSEPCFLRAVADVEVGFGTDEVVDRDRDRLRIVCSAAALAINAEL
jgi:hypothetical protein